MTYKKLKEIIERNGVPEDVHLMSNSGWECSATERWMVVLCQDLVQVKMRNFPSF